MLCEVFLLNNKLDDRCIQLGEHIAKNAVTVRAAAKKFGVSKSTVHKDVSVRLKKLNPSLYRKVQKILEINKKERHIRGGIATRKKYKGI